MFSVYSVVVSGFWISKFNIQHSKLDYLDNESRNSYTESMKTIVSEKGQITIPKAVRDSLGLSPGVTLEIESENGRLIGVKREAGDALARWRGRGKVPVGRTTDGYLAAVRDDHRR